MALVSMKIGFNTSYVVIKLTGTSIYKIGGGGFNTSYVVIKP